MLICAFLGPYFVNRNAVEQFQTKLNEIREVNYNALNQSLSEIVNAATELANSHELLSVMQKNQEYRLRTLRSPIISTLESQSHTIDLSARQPLEQFTERLTDQQRYVAKGMIGMQLMTTDATVLGTSSNFSQGQLSRQDIFDAIKQSETSAGESFVAAGAHIVPLITPLKNANNALLGALITEFDISPVLRSIRNHNASSSELRIHLVQNHNADVSAFATLNSGFLPNDIATSSIYSSIARTEIRADSSGDKNHHYAYINIPLTGWGLVVSGALSANSSLSIMIQYLNLLLVGIYFAILATGWFLIRRSPLATHNANRSSDNQTAQTGSSSEQQENIPQGGHWLSQNFNSLKASSNNLLNRSKPDSQSTEYNATNNSVPDTEICQPILNTIERFKQDSTAFPLTIFVVQLRDVPPRIEGENAAIVDELVSGAAQRLRTVIKRDPIIRHKDNGFTVFSTLTNEESAKEVAYGIDSMFTTSFETSSGEVLIASDTGYATADSPQSIDQVLEDAEAQLTQYVGTSINQNTEGSYSKIIGNAIKDKRLATWYQPIVKVSNGDSIELVGAEAFMRIYDEQGDIIPPNLFMSEIQNTPIGELLEHLVLKQALDTLHDWHQQKKLPQNFQLSINASRHTVRNTKIVKLLQGELEKLKLPAASIALEISGGNQLINSDVIFDLQELGVTLTMDDVGLKFSNIEQLISIEPTYVKIDQRRLEIARAGSKNTSAQLRINKLLQQIGTEIIAKSVESDQQIVQLTAQGISYFQGYFFDEPREADGFIEKWGVKSGNQVNLTHLRKAS